MHGCNHSIGCLSVTSSRLGDGLSVSATRVGFDKKHEDLNLSAWRIGNGISVSAGVVCDVAGGAYIRFKDDILVWIGDDNNEGVMKYNVLTATGAWSLEEVEIEELL